MTPCHIWLWGQKSDGYGVLKVAGKTQSAHRAMWLQENGPIPDGLVVRHKCDNRLCTNLDHLELGTIGDNVKDREDRNRGSKGESRPSHKLTADQVRVIRSLKGKHTDIAKDYGVSAKTIESIRNNRKWRSIL